MPKSKKESKLSDAQLYAVVAIAVVIAAAIIAIIYVSQPPSFSEFKSSFVSASQVAIFAMYNGTHLGIGGSSAASCATAVIEQLHRAPSTINFFEVNQTSCTFATSGLGANSTSSSNSVSANYTTTTGIGRCINMSRGMPTLYINYSTENETVIGRGTLYVSGNLLFLRECGIAVQLT
jgi:hypothetical protein